MRAVKLLKRGFSRFRRGRYQHHFIHIPKNGGISVRAAVRKMGDVSLSNPFHYRYVDIADDVGRHLKFFCIIRNPWSRTASRFEYAKQNCHKWPEDDPRRIYISSATFEDYVRERKIFPIPGHAGMPWMGPMNSWFNQLDWITDESGNVVCDCLRFELLDSDMASYFGRPVTLPRENVTVRKYDYREMYSDETAQIIADAFHEDIEYFGFSFEGAATRHVMATE